MSQITLLNGPERRRRWHEGERARILEAGAGANVSDVARRFDVSTSLIYKWRAMALTEKVEPNFVPAVVIDEGADTSVPVREPVIKVQFVHGATVLIEAKAPAALATAALRALR